MADRMVIYDSDLELGAVVDMDEMRALGPVGGGPNAREELNAFIVHMPEQVWNLTTYDLATAYLQFWQQEFAGLYEPAESDSAGEVVEPPDTRDDAARQAEHEARANAAAPPPPQPADTDMEADAGEANQVAQSGVANGDTSDESRSEPEQYQGECYACQGRGTVPMGEGGAPVVCNLCRGTGQLPAPAPTT